MVSYSEIFNVNSTALPLKKEELSSVINKSTMIGYYPCAYNNLISTLKTISSAKELSVSLNPLWLYNNTNNPLSACECIIQVEGMQTFDEFVNKIVQNEEDNTWTDFTTYSPLFRGEIKDVKLAAYKKFLWNYDNIENWIRDKHVAILGNKKNEIVSSFEAFTAEILNTNDYQSFIKSCNSDDIEKAISWMVKQGISKLTKYSNELTRHISNNNKREDNVLLKNPLIVKIFLLNHVANACRKEYPKIRFATLDKKNFDSISLWDV